MKVLVLLLGLGGVVFLLAGGCSGQFTTWYTDSQGVQAHPLLVRLHVREQP